MRAHNPECYLLEHRNCPNSRNKDGTHWYSGWPGAYCMDCGDEDKMELCIGLNCKCWCHDAFWKDVNDNLPPPSLTNVPSL